MKTIRYTAPFLLIFLAFACAESAKEIPRTPFAKVDVTILKKDSSSIRALDIVGEEVIYAGSNGKYGYFQFKGEVKSTGKELINSIAKPNDLGTVSFIESPVNFRSIAQNKTHFFVMSIENPALLYRINKKTKAVDLVYQENHEMVFYDAMAFWNGNEAIAIGDPINGCLSIIISRDGGANWKKMSCDQLPASIDGEAAFAASDTNIKIIGDKTWIVSGGGASRVWYSSDRGKNWEIFETPIIQGEPTQGGYSMDFYDEQRGIIYGGDYTKPELNRGNIVATMDGGKSWELIGVGANQGYKSCVQYVPNTKGNGIVALGFTGISYSSDAGQSWKHLSNEAFLSFRFVNDSIAIATGRNKVAQLLFK